MIRHDYHIRLPPLLQIYCVPPELIGVLNRYTDTFDTQDIPPLDRHFDIVALPWLSFYRCFVADTYHPLVWILIVVRIY